MRKAIVFLLLFLAGGLASGGTTIGTGVQIGSSDGAGLYNVTQWDLAANLTINASEITLSGMPALQDTASNTSGLWCQDSASCTIDDIAADEQLWMNDWIGNTSGPVVRNITGASLQDVILTYNTTGGGNITLKLDDLTDDCNYGKFAITGNTSNVEYFYFERSLVAYTACDVTIELNSTEQADVLIEVKEDESMSDTTLATILAAMGLTSILVSHGYQHKSKSTS